MLKEQQRNTMPDRFGFGGTATDGTERLWDRRLVDGRRRDTRCFDGRVREKRHGYGFETQPMYGAYYGANPIISKIDHLAGQIQSIARKYVKAYQVSKIAELMSLAKQRDNLIVQGYESDAPKVAVIDNKARRLINPTPADDARAENLAWERDDLIRQAVRQGLMG